MRGFSVIEVLVALVIIAVGALGMMQMMLKTDQNNEVIFQHQLGYREALFIRSALESGKPLTTLVESWKQSLQAQLPKLDVELATPRVILSWYPPFIQSPMTIQV